jgi:hypothetical protein
MRPVTVSHYAFGAMQGRKQALEKLVEREESSGSHKLLRALKFSKHSGSNTIKFSRASPAPSGSSGLPSPGNDDPFAERSLIFLLADRLHRPQLRQQIVDQQTQTRPRRATRK